MLPKLFLIIVAYVILRFVLPVKATLSLKIILTLFLILGSQMHLIYQRFGGMNNWLIAEFPRLVMILFPLLLAFLLSLFFFSFLFDIYLTIKLVFKNIITIERNFLIMILLSLGLASFMLYEGVKVANVKTVEIKIDKLPQELVGTKIVLIADLHASALNTKPLVQEIIDKTNSLNPDIVLFNGDMVDGLVKNRLDSMKPIKDLKAKYVYGVVGNHEYYADFENWLKTFKDLGIKLLNNDNQILTINNQKLALIGLTYASPNIAQATANIDKNITTILMEHIPKNAKANAAYDVDLQLSGHTHGGMLWGVNKLLIARFNGGFVSGLYNVDKMQLYVSNGTSLWQGFPLRLFVPSELTEFILVRD